MKYKEKMENLLSLRRAPSQFEVFMFLLESGKIMTVREISEYLDLTNKATERAIAKLLDKDIVKRSTFREASYKVDVNEILVTLFIVLTELYEEYEKSKR